MNIKLFRLSSIKSTHSFALINPPQSLQLARCWLASWLAPTACRHYYYLLPCFFFLRFFFVIQRNRSPPAVCVTLLCPRPLPPTPPPPLPLLNTVCAPPAASWGNLAYIALTLRYNMYPRQVYNNPNFHHLMSNNEKKGRNFIGSQLIFSVACSLPLPLLLLAQRFALDSALMYHTIAATRVAEWHRAAAAAPKAAFMQD